MEQKNTHVMYGAISGIGCIVIALVIHIAKLDTATWAGWLVYIPFLGGLILNAMAFSKANDGNITFKSAFGSCFKATLIIGIFMVLWAVITVYAFPEIKEMALEKAREGMMKQPGMSDDTMDKALEFTSKGYTTIMISSAVFGSLIAGAIFSLIAAAVAPKKPQPIDAFN